MMDFPSIVRALMEAGFSSTVKAAGCDGYMVSFPGARVMYFGRSAETHVEHFRQATEPVRRP